MSDVCDVTAPPNKAKMLVKLGTDAEMNTTNNINPLLTNILPQQNPK